MRVTYEPGGMLTIVADDGLAVLPGGLPQDMIEDVWEGLDSGDGVAAVLDALGRAFGPETAGLPPFAVALLQGEAVRTAVRGDLRVTVDRLSGPLELTGGGSDTWTVRLVEDALSVLVRPGLDAPASASELPIASGVVLAATARAVFFEPSDTLEPARPQGDDARDAPVPNDLVDAEVPLDTLLAGDDAPVAHPIPDPLPPVDALPPVPPLPPLPPIPPLPPLPEVPAAPPAAAPGGEFPADTLDPMHLSGPVEPLEPLEREPLGDHDGATLSAAQFAALRGQADEPAPEPDDVRGDHDGVTLLVPRPAPVAGPVTAEIPLEEVSAAPAHAFESLATQQMPAVPRARARIRISTGEVVDLDRTVIIGRRPRSSRTTGADMPRLVAVESPQNDISRNHIEVSTDGETVIVTDLHTTNGTVLHRTGPLGAATDPTRLHPGERTVVIAGDVVDLGDGVTVAFEELP